MIAQVELMARDVRMGVEKNGWDDVRYQQIGTVTCLVEQVLYQGTVKHKKTTEEVLDKKA